MSTFLKGLILLVIVPNPYQDSVGQSDIPQTGGGSGLSLPRGVLLWAGRRSLGTSLCVCETGGGGTKAQCVGLFPQSTALWMAGAWVFWDYCCRLGDGEASAQLRCSSPLLSCLSVGRHVCRREPPLPPLHFSRSHSHTHTLIEFRWGGGMRLREEGISFKGK